MSDHDWQQPSQQHPAYQNPAYQQPVPPAQASAQPSVQSPLVPAPSSRLPKWTWPAIAGLALILGLGGGAVGGALVAGSDDQGSGRGGVLEVERRTAAPLPADNDSVAAVAAKVLPSTVQILARVRRRPARGDRVRLRRSTSPAT